MRCLRIIAALFLIITFTTSCTNKEVPSKDTLVVALEAQPNSLDPRFETTANGQRVIGLLFNSLVRIGSDLKTVGDAAESWTYDKLTYKFKLKKGLTFSNGRAVSKDDLIFTFQQYQSDKCPFKSSFKIIKSVEVDDQNPDGMILSLKLSEFSAVLLSTDLPLVKILPKQEVEQAGDDFQKNPIGTGSYKLISKDANSILLEARDSHPIAVPKIKKLEIKIIADDNTRYLKTVKGAVDIAQNVLPSTKIKDFEKNEEFQIHKFPSLSMNYLLVNMKDPVLKNLYVRQVLNSAINRSEIIQFKLDGLASPATGIMSPASPFHASQLIPPVFDLSKATSLVQLNKLTEKEISLKTTNTQESIEIGKVIGNQIDKTGLRIKLQSFESSTFFKDLGSGNFQLASLRWVGVTDPDIYRLAFHSKEVPPGRNRGSYSNPLLDKMLEKGLTLDKETERLELYNKIQAIVFEDLPMIPLWYPMQVAVINKRVKGYQPPMNGDFSAFMSVTKD